MIRLGCSGWSYDEWVGPFYRSREESKLARYSKVFDTAEIDSTFYAYPSKGVVLGWNRHTPKDFVFASKLPRVITHEKVLDLKKGVEEDLRKFLELMAPLMSTEKLGCALIQLPPSLGFEPELLANFLGVLPFNPRFAIEFRNREWIRPETWTILRENRVAYAIVDEPLLPAEEVVTTDFSYIRWHGRGKRPWYNYRYERPELEGWLPKVQRVSEKAGRTYGYFNNHYHGYAVENCLQLLELRGSLTGPQIQAKRHLESHRRGELMPELI